MTVTSDSSSVSSVSSYVPRGKKFHNQPRKRLFNDQENPTGNKRRPESTSLVTGNMVPNLVAGNVDTTHISGGTNVMTTPNTHAPTPGAIPKKQSF